VRKESDRKCDKKIISALLAMTGVFMDCSCFILDKIMEINIKDILFAFCYTLLDQIGAVKKPDNLA